MKAQTVPRITAKILLPYILLFGLYVQFHGDFGPGGGFQAGVIFAAGIVLYALIFGTREQRRVLPRWVVRVLVGLGVAIYGGVGLATMALGGRYLDYSVLAHDPVHGQHLGIFLVELGVGITVCGVMVALFDAFATRREP